MTESKAKLLTEYGREVDFLLYTKDILAWIKKLIETNPNIIGNFEVRNFSFKHITTVREVSMDQDGNLTIDVNVKNEDGSSTSAVRNIIKERVPEFIEALKSLTSKSTNKNVNEGPFGATRH